MKDKPQGLSVEQIEFACKQVRKWMEICEENNRGIGPADVDHSSLLRRLLSGKAAHPVPPPMRFSYPAWELVESDEVEIHELFTKGDEVFIDQHGGYSWVDEENGVVRYDRLDITYQIVSREVIPDASVVRKGLDPAEFKYTARFMKKRPLS